MHLCVGVGGCFSMAAFKDPAGDPIPTQVGGDETCSDL